MNRIHVNSLTLRSNAERQRDEPVMLMHDRDDAVTRGKHVVIHGPSRIVYRPTAPLSCGATVWIETNSEVTIMENECH